MRASFASTSTRRYDGRVASSINRWVRLQEPLSAAGSAALTFVMLIVICLALVVAPSAVAATQAEGLASRVHELAFELKQVQKTTNSVFTPITVLIGILGAGGALGIVFSFRD